MLLGLLKEGQQNKQLVAETIISQGQLGEQKIIQLIRKRETESRLINNAKAKECLVKSLALAEVSHPNIDFVVETLFYCYQRESNQHIRKAALLAIDILSSKARHLQSSEQANFNSSDLQSTQRSNYQSMSHSSLHS